MQFNQLEILTQKQTQPEGLFYTSRDKRPMKNMEGIMKEDDLPILGQGNFKAIQNFQCDENTSRLVLKNG